MNTIDQIMCTLVIPRKFYQELSNEIKDIFIEKAGSYYTEFPADAEENSFLGEYIQAFCEVVLVMKNPKYEVTNECEVSSQLLKMGSSEENFTMLVEIKYPGEAAPHSDVLVFREISQSLGYYSFELVGDQRLFAVD